MSDFQKKIYIDFLGGAHGNYLEFVCNRMLAGVLTSSPLPFNKLGASHQKTYLSPKVFFAEHYTTDDIILKNQNVIFVKVEIDDLLPMQCISLLRAGDLNIDPNELEFNTYHKLNNKHYKWVLDNIIDHFFDPEVFIAGYDSIADESWPKISNLKDYNALPENIRQECESRHGFKFHVLNEESPHCPKYILREFFKYGFLFPENHGFIVLQTPRHQNCRNYDFKFSSFYDIDKFFREINSISEFFNLGVDINHDELLLLHQEFLSRQPYRQTKNKCNRIVNKILNNEPIDLGKLNVIEEAYIEAVIEKNTGKSISRELDQWFLNGSEISDYLK